MIAAPIYLRNDVHCANGDADRIRTVNNEKVQISPIYFFDRPALLNHAEMLRCANISACHKKDGRVRPVLHIYLLKKSPI
jgi:hypothetical protein